MDAQWQVGGCSIVTRVKDADGTALATITCMSPPTAIWALLCPNGHQNWRQCCDEHNPALRHPGCAACLRQRGIEVGLIWMLLTTYS